MKVEPQNIQTREFEIGDLIYTSNTDYYYIITYVGEDLLTVVNLSNGLVTDQNRHRPDCILVKDKITIYNNL